MSETKLERVTLHDSDLDVDVNINAAGELLTQIRANTSKTGTGTSLVPLVDSDGHLQVDVISGGGGGGVGGVQYTEGDVDDTITGTAIMFEADTETSTIRAVSNDYPLPVSDANSSLTVDGTVNIGSALPAGNNNIGDVDVVTYPGPSSSQLPTTLTAGGNLKTAVLEALPAGTNNIGDVDVVTYPGPSTSQLPSTLTAAGNLKTAILEALPAGTNNIGDVDVLTYPGPSTSQLPSALTAGGNLKTAILEALPAGTNNIGNVGHGKTIKSVTGTATATTTIVPAVSGKRIKVIAYSLITSSTTAVTCTFKDGVNGAALWTVPLQALSGTISGANLAISAPSFLFGTTASNALELALSAAVSVTYSVTYFDDDTT